MQIDSMLNCKIGEFLIIYLGIPLRPSKLHNTDWQPLIDKTDSRLAGCKDSNLSRGGRLVLANPILTTMPFNMMPFYHFPKWVRNIINKVRRRFLWEGGKEELATICLVNWDEVCKSKIQGGFSVLNLKYMNAGEMILEI